MAEKKKKEVTFGARLIPLKIGMGFGASVRCARAHTLVARKKNLICTSRAPKQRSTNRKGRKKKGRTDSPFLRRRVVAVRIEDFAGRHRHITHTPHQKSTPKKSPHHHIVPVPTVQGSD